MQDVAWGWSPGGLHTPLPMGLNSGCTFPRMQNLALCGNTMSVIGVSGGGGDNHISNGK